MDLDALREAVEIWDRFRNPTDDKRPNRDRTAEATELLVAAARAVLDSEEIWWCDTHGMPYTPAPIGECAWWGLTTASFADPKPCKPTTYLKVRRRLLAEEGR